MADLMTALKETKGQEGIWSDDPDDPGRGTVWGIARAFHPELVELWVAVDRRKGLPGFPGNLDSPEVHVLVNKYYQENEWGAVCGAQLKDQLIANELFDTAVNIGSHFTVQFLQLTLNALNRGGELWQDLELDGKMEGTLKAVDTLLKEKDGFRLLWQGLNTWQGAYYMMGGKDQWKAFIAILKATPPSAIREKYMRGWLLNRAFNSKAA